MSVRGRVTQVQITIASGVRCQSGQVLIGRSAADPGLSEEITLGAGLSLNNGVLSATVTSTPMAEEIDAAAARTIDGTENTGVSVEGTLGKFTLSALKTWILNGLTIAWGSVSGKPSTFPPIIGSGAGDAVAGNDSRLTNSRTPTAHKSTHATGGTDALTPADIGAQPAGSYAAASHTHVSASVTDASTGTSANPLDDAAKLAKFDAFGGLNAAQLTTYFFGSPKSTINNWGTILYDEYTAFKVYDVGSPSGVLTADREYYFPNASGFRALTDQTDGKTNLEANVTGTLPVANGGTGATTASAARTALEVPGSVVAGVSGADAITNIISLTQAEYDAIGSKSSTTLYVIT